MTLQRTRSFTKSMATDLVRPIKAALEAPYTKRLGTPITELATEDMLMIDPPPRAIIPGRKLRVMRKADFTLRLNEKSKSASVVVRSVPAWTNPAQLKRTSTPP